MKRFQFAFDRILNVRTYQEKLAKEEFGKAVQNTERVRRTLEEAKEELGALEAGESDRREKSTTISDFLSYEDRHGFLQKNIHENVEELSRAEKEQEERRLVLVKASQEKKKYETLKRNRWREYLKEFGKEEQEELDDVGAASFQYRKMEQAHG